MEKYNGYFWTAYATVVFWSITIFSTLLAAVCIAINPIQWNHDGITTTIRIVMLGSIHYVMTKLRIWRVSIVDMSGNEEFEGPVIYAANHQSIIDSIYMPFISHDRYTFVYNYKYRFVPIIGPLCVMAGYVAVDTTSKAKIREVPDLCAKKVQQGWSLLLYPEGKRNRTNNTKRLLKLKTGAFRVAQMTGAPIVPIHISGTQNVFNGGICNFGSIVLRKFKSFNVGTKDGAILQVLHFYEQVIQESMDETH